MASPKTYRVIHPPMRPDWQAVDGSWVQMNTDSRARYCLEKKLLQEGEPSSATRLRQGLQQSSFPPPRSTPPRFMAISRTALSSLKRNTVVFAVGLPLLALLPGQVYEVGNGLWPDPRFCSSSATPPVARLTWVSGGGAPKGLSCPPSAPALSTQDWVGGGVLEEGGCSLQGGRGGQRGTEASKSTAATNVLRTVEPIARCSRHFCAFLSVPRGAQTGTSSSSSRPPGPLGISWSPGAPRLAR